MKYQPFLKNILVTEKQHHKDLEDRVSEWRAVIVDYYEAAGSWTVTTKGEDRPEKKGLGEND